MTRTLLAMLLAGSVAAIAIEPAHAQSGIMLGERPISRAEVMIFVKKQFARMDTNHDGHVRPDEFEAYRAQQGDRSQTGLGHVGRRWFEKSDADQDGAVTLREAEARPIELFDIADVNHDGIASVQEQTVAQIFMGK